MANDIKINVQLKTQLDAIKSTVSQYKDSFSNTQTIKINDYIKQLEKTLSQESLSLKDLQSVGSLFRNLTDVLKTAGLAASNFSDELKELIKQQSKALDTVQTKEQELDIYRRRGRFEKNEKGEEEFRLFTSFLDKQVTEAGIQYKGLHGKKQDLKTYNTLVKRIEQVENGAKPTDIFASDEDYKKAKALLDKINLIRELTEKGFVETSNSLKIAVEEYNKITKQVKAKKKTEKASPLFEAGSNTQETVLDLISAESEKLKTEKELQETTSQVSALTNSLNKQQTALGKAFKQFTLYNLILRGTKTALRSAIQTIKELDQSLTEQAMVTGMTRAQTYNLIKDYQELALQVGATTKEIAGVATEYMKQGKTIEEAKTLTEAAVAAAKVARVSVGDSVNYLTTALNGFRLSAEDAMKVSDKFAAVAAASATDYDELAIALSKVASQANLAGMSIDYTTALLTKGLETTREAPETMGTALKTIIARMRELGDYGETLEGDTDINNVESQLAYVGIALRNTNGELRSTEDVLDDLGKEWDSLNTNQQAALAKALAGTRQQSRLIAMMDDYERVIELQEIAQRSAGATSAQAATYLEGMAASLNKISVAWEKIVTNLTNADVVIWLLDRVSAALGNIGNILGTLPGQILLFSTIGVSLLGIISKKMLENKIAKENIELQRTQQRLELLKYKQLIENNKREALSVKYQADIAELKRLQNKIDNKKKLSSTEQKRLQQLQEQNPEEKFEAEFNNSLQESREYQNILSQLNLLDQEHNKLASFSYMWLNLKNIAQAISNKHQALAIKLTKLSTKSTQQDTIATNIQTAAKWANIAAWSIFAVVAVAAVVALIAVMINWQTQSEKTAEEVKELSNQIYKLNESSTAIKKAASEFDNLDNKIIKTKEDLEAMKESMNSVADSIDWTVGGKYSEEEAEARKKEYSEMADPESQRAYLEDIQEEIDTAIKDKREDQITKLGTLSQAERNELFEKDLAVLSAVRATNNAYLYEEIDELKKTSELTEEQMAATEDLGQRILSNLSAQEAYNWATEQGRENIKALVTQLEQLNVGEILTSNDYKLSEQIDAYTKAYNSLEGDARDALREEFRALDTMASWDSITIGLIEHLNLTADEVNNIAKAIQKLGFSSEESLLKFDLLLKNINSSGNVQDSIMSIFGTQIGNLDTEEGKKLYNTILNAYAEAIGVGILNMGQNLDKLNNTINDFYKKAAEWSTMSKAEQTQFLNDNAKLFNNNADLLKAFESGNYQAIEEALKNSEALQEQVKDRIAEIEQEIALERAKLVEDQNTAYIKMLQEELEYLNNSEELFEVSLETQLKQQEEQLNTYKEYLQEQKDALEDSLNKRKEAYQKYFDAINRDEEDEEYDEQANTLISNLSKLSSSTNADAKKQSKELENQLKELEEERLKTLRERAQEAVIENMDDTLDEINNKFDELINNNKALLAAMQGDLGSGRDFLARLMDEKVKDGATALELESFWKELESTYSSVLTGIDWDSFKASESGNSMFLNVNGRTVELSPSNQQSVYEIIMKALKQVGVS